MKQLICIITILLFSGAGQAAAYLGGNYGYSSYSNDSIKDHKVSVKGPSYGGFLGFGRDFVGLEGFYQSFTAEGEIKHDDGTHTFTGDATAMGAALRFSFELLYFRLGAARYTLNQSVDISDEDSRDAAEEIYGIEKKGTSKNGVLYGVGWHTKLGGGRIFVDYSRYQINSVGNFDVISAGYSFTIPERWFNLGKY